MASIRKIKLKRGTAHEVRYSQYGARLSKYFPPEIPYSSVKRFATEVEFNKAHERAGIVAPTGAVSLTMLADLYCKRRASELDTWREALAMKRFIAIVGNVPAARVDHHALHKFRDQLLEDRMPADPNYSQEQKIRRGVNKELRIIRTVFLWAYRNEVIPGKPFEKVTFFRETPNVPDVLSREELDLLYRALPRRGPSRLIFLLLRFTGRRRSEILRLRRGDIDLVAAKIHISKTKNGQAITVPIHPRLLRILSWTISDLTPDVQLFNIAPLSVTRNFKRAMIKTGINKKMPVHILRHTFGARVIERYLTTGDGERIAQEALGHKSRVMTRHYTQIVKDQLGEALANVDF